MLRQPVEPLSSITTRKAAELLGARHVWVIRWPFWPSELPYRSGRIVDYRLPYSHRNEHYWRRSACRVGHSMNWCGRNNNSAIMSSRQFTYLRVTKNYCSIYETFDFHEIQVPNNSKKFLRQVPGNVLGFMTFLVEVLNHLLGHSKVHVKHTFNIFTRLLY